MSHHVPFECYLSCHSSSHISILYMMESAQFPTCGVLSHRKCFPIWCLQCTHCCFLLKHSLVLTVYIWLLIHLLFILTWEVRILLVLFLTPVIAAEFWMVLLSPKFMLKLKHRVLGGVALGQWVKRTRERRASKDINQGREDGSVVKSTWSSCRGSRPRFPAPSVA